MFVLLPEHCCCNVNSKCYDFYFCIPLFLTVATANYVGGKRERAVGSSGKAATTVDTTVYDAEIAAAKEVLLDAAVNKKRDSNEVVASLLSLEKLMRAKNKLDNDETSRETVSNLTGTWKLIFTTGTVDTQKKIGKINYFPLDARQSFQYNRKSDSSVPNLISNGIYLNNFELLKFFGEFEWIEKKRKLEFDFDEIVVFGLKFRLPKKKDDGKKRVKPFFLWISADENFATARGGEYTYQLLFL